MTKNEALKLALEALTNAYWPNESDLMPSHNFRECAEAITAIKEALAQPEQTPYITMPPSTPMWSIPLQRTWVGLTEKDICEAAVKSQEGISPRDDTLRFAIAIEAKLKEKNT